MIDVELSAAERPAILREHVSQLEGSKDREPALRSEVGDDVIDDALYENRGSFWRPASTRAASTP